LKARASIALLVCVMLTAIGWPSLAQADEPGAWLEAAQPANWNLPGADVPAAPAPTGDIDPRCGAQERPSESPEDDDVVNAGWHLFNAARVGWGLWIVDGLVDYDGMCRPNQFQGFVFLNSQFAGTISPTPMDSRTDGSGRLIDVRGPGTLTAQFVRYTPSDPLCCPSSVFGVEYVIDRSGNAPVLVPQRSTRTNAFLSLNL
jgi:hypothetical protein